ncbi:acetate--CoA ligase family protein [Paracoccus homiensis]|uniref:Acyl-CoA synthetase (NDP forming) n=1 Tax=Paracoccus homiensis TaxID=364199 RepID=A0A1I0HF71_9RHOB|nr:acetate--CoA ligase family protein [Paracoccus homiensis]SET82521.1 Acyl-CoA synthetase (NDP forming) [Paracoccus homiensis]
MTRLERLMRPRSIAVVGGGTWCRNVIAQCRQIGFDGPIWPVHPSRDQIEGLPAFASIADLPAAPDAAFIGVNREASVQIVGQLAQRGTGGAICFASGFSEAAAELPDGAQRQRELVTAAGSMPILGPNCYGLINALDGAALWPDLHGMQRCTQGVAIVTQSSNISINLTMQRRGLPIAYMATAGNQAQIGLAQIGAALLNDPRVTALGLHIEGIGDLPAFLALARQARDLGKPVVALKVGASQAAQAAMISHTASLSGSDAGARALLHRLGIGICDDPAVFLETLKLLHVTGGITSNRIASMSCSGGEASLMADLGQAQGIVFPQLGFAQREGLRQALGPRVALANPLDYHTYIWGDTQAMAHCFGAMMRGDLALGCVVLDFPRPDRFAAPEWQQVLDAMALTDGRAPLAVISSLPENMPEAVAQDCIARGIVPFAGMSQALAAIAIAAGMVRPAITPDPWQPGDPQGDRTLTEAEAKAALATAGLRSPGAARAQTPPEAAAAAARIGFPVVIKGEGIAHKTEAGAVVLNLADPQAVERAAREMVADSYLIEEMIPGGVAELLIGVVRDPAHGFVLTLGAGGVLTELMRDTTSLLLPASRDQIRTALQGLRCWPLLAGYRGKPPANLEAVLDAVLAVQAFVKANLATLHEVEVNPLICTPTDAIAADAIIRQGETP